MGMGMIGWREWGMFEEGEWKEGSYHQIIKIEEMVSI